MRTRMNANFAAAAVSIATGAALLAPALSQASCFSQDKPWTVRIGVHNIDPTGGTNHLNGGAVDVRVESKIGPTINLDYRVCRNLTVDVLGAVPLTHDLIINGSKLGSTRHLPPTVTLQYHPIPDSNVDPYVGVGVNRTFFFNESLNGALTGNRLQLSNTWGVAAAGGVDWKFARSWLVGADLRYVQIEPNASLNGTPIGKVKINPLVYGVNVGYRF